MNKILNSHNKWLDYFLILAGTAAAAFSSKIFLDPAGIVPGGFTGIAIIIKKLSEGIIEGGIPLWVTNLILNIPFLPMMIRLYGWESARKTAAGTLLFSFWLAVIPYFCILEEQDMFLISVFGGASMGIGIGLVFMGRGTTGGTDMCGAILQHYFPHMSMPKLMQLLDIVIVACGIFVFGMHMALYSVVVVYITARVSDRMLDGLKYSRMAYIISDRSEEIAAAIMKNMERGVTGINGKGMYTNKEKTILMCVFSPKEIIKIKDIVGQVDQHAFVIVNDSREVMGEGFIEYKC